MMKLANGVLGMALAVAVCGTSVMAQDSAPATKPVNKNPVVTFHLTNISQTQDATEITTAIRNLLTPESKVFLVLNQNILIVQAAPDQLELTQKLLNDLDRPKRSYRLTYTITESDAGKRIGTQHFNFVVVSGQRTSLKQGSKVPVVTGSYNPGTSNAQTQFTYLDVGLNFDATIEESVNGVQLSSKAEQSSLSEEKPVSGLENDPIVRQTVLQGTSILIPGKPLILGSLDYQGSTRHLEIEVVMEVLK